MTICSNAPDLPWKTVAIKTSPLSSSAKLSKLGVQGQFEHEDDLSKILFGVMWFVPVG